MVESMCQGGFLNKSETEAWEFLEELSKKTLQWETTRDESLGSRINHQRGGVHAVADTTYIDTRIAALENMVKGLVMPQQPTNYPTSQMVACSHCQSLDHSLSTCPMFAQQLATGQEQGQVNAAFQRPKFDPYSSTYNPGWAKHPNFSWSGTNAQSGNYQGNSSSLPNQRPPFQGAYNAPRPLPPQHQVPQSYPPPGYNELDKVNKKVNDMERMIRELKESNERMMRTMSEQFAQLAMSNREKGTFPSQPEANPRGGSSSSFDPNDVRKVNAVISLRSGKKVDTHVGEPQANELPSPAPSSPTPPCVVVNPTVVDALPPKEVDDSKGDESNDSSTPPKSIPTSSPCVSAPPPPFPNRLKGKKTQTHVDKIREVFSQVKVNIPLLDAIQQMPLTPVF